MNLKKSANWHVIDELSNGVEDGKEISPDIERMVTVPAGAGEAVSFPIIPKVLGNIPVVVQAQSTEASDAVRRNLLVEVRGWLGCCDSSVKPQPLVSVQSEVPEI